MKKYGFLFTAVLYELCKARMVIIVKCTAAIFFLRRIGPDHLPLLSHLTEVCVQSRDPPASGWARQLSAQFWVDQRWWKLPSNLQLRRTYSENKLKDLLQLMYKPLWCRKVVLCAKARIRGLLKSSSNMVALLRKKKHIYTVSQCRSYCHALLALFLHVTWTKTLSKAQWKLIPYSHRLNMLNKTKFRKMKTIKE